MSLRPCSIFPAAEDGESTPWLHARVMLYPRCHLRDSLGPPSKALTLECQLNETRLPCSCFRVCLDMMTQSRETETEHQTYLKEKNTFLFYRKRFRDGVGGGVAQCFRARISRKSAQLRMPSRRKECGRKVELTLRVGLSEATNSKSSLGCLSK